jgi:hypothetical protein
MFKRFSPAVVIAQVVAMLVLSVAPAFAATPIAHTSGSLSVGGNLTVTGTTTNSGAVSNTGNEAIGGNLTVTGTTTLTTTLTKANVRPNLKRQRVFTLLSPPTAAAVDSTVYRALIPFGRAGTVTGVSWVCQTAPTVGTDTLKVLKGSSAGNTMLSTATVDANGLVANTITNGTLTATGADLIVTATQPVYVEYSAGVQTVDAIGLGVCIEFEPDDY